MLGFNVVIIYYILLCIIFLKIYLMRDLRYFNGLKKCSNFVLIIIC